jgi:predicted ATPase/DNA-binding CsgD family transcriptional regulator
MTGSDSPLTPSDRASAFPEPPSRLIGREQDLLALSQLLLRDDVRLVTITGAAGIGKTRLAFAVAVAVEDRFPDGGLFVDLSTVSDPTRVIGAIGNRLGLPKVRPADALERVGQAVRDRTILLFLDNFEQVLPAATDLASLLAGSHRLKLLVTSRAPLRLRWEHVFETPPLDLPELDRLPAPEQLGRIAAVALFVDRAEAAGSDFHLDRASARAVAELCVRLDGLPLALELAATQMRLVSPVALLARLEFRLDLLAGGAQDQPERQHTLREAIGWSYRLLSDAERPVFRRLAVFVGGIGLDAARAIVPGEGGESGLLARLTALVDQNLLRRETLVDGEPYFKMLETIREYARERLAEAGELEQTQYKNAEFWCELAEAAELELRGPAQVAWLNRLEREWPNLFAALAWSDRAGKVELGVRLAAALGWFWYLRGGDRWEGRTWLERFGGRAIAIPSAAPARARALSVAGVLAQYQLDLSAALALQESALALGRALRIPAIEAVVLGRLAHLCLFRNEFERADELAVASFDQCRLLDDGWGMAFALATRGLIARSQGMVDAATRYLLEGLTHFRQRGDRWGIAHVQLGLGQLALHLGDDRLAEQCWEERLSLSRELGNLTAVGHTLDLLATVASQRGDHAAATARFEEALAIKRQIGDRQATAWSLHGLGTLALRRGDTRIAYTNLRESLLLRCEIAEQAGIVASLIAFSHLAALLRRPRRALRLAGAAESLYQAIGSALAVQPYSQQFFAPALVADDPYIGRAQRLLGNPQRTAAWEEGAALTPEQAVAEALALETELGAAPEASRPALAGTPRGALPAGTGATGTDPEPSAADLTRREREVAALLARGYTNRQIGATLVITEGSAHLHVVRLFRKLGLHTRAQAAVWAVTHHLASGPADEAGD